jgi:tetratricopeptide (TPR) repeat protein/DNA-binding CsgD family transcriptional regulator
MKKTYILIFLCLLHLTLLLPLSAQNNEIDSLQQLLPRATDKEKIDIYINLSMLHRGISYEKIIEYGKKAHAIAKKIDDNENIIVALTHIGIANAYTGNYDTSSIIFQKIYFLADSLGDSSLLINALNNLGNLYYHTNKYDLALEYYYRVYDYCHSNNDKLFKARLLQNIGNVYRDIEKLNESLQSFFESKKLYTELNDTLRSHKINSSIGLVYTDLGKYDSALYYLELGNKYAIADKNHEALVSNYNNLGFTYLILGQKEKALLNLKKSIQLADESDFPFQAANAMLSIVDLYLRSEEYDSAMVYLKKTEKYSDPIDSDDINQTMNEYYYQVFLAGHNYQKALHHYITSKTISDSIFSKERTNKIDALQIRYETAKKENQIKVLKKDIKIKEVSRKLLGLAAFTLALIVLSLIFYFRFKRKALLQEKLLAENETNFIRKELDLQNKELVCKTINIAELNEMKAEMANNIKKLLPYSNSEGKKLVFSMIGSFGNVNDKEIWDEFETRFEKVNSSFYNNLYSRQPNLTPTERKVCAFLKLNMSTKDIASLLHINVRSVESNRYNIRKKLMMDKSENLIAYLQGL